MIAVAAARRLCRRRTDGHGGARATRRQAASGLSQLARDPATAAGDRIDSASGERRVIVSGRHSGPVMGRSRVALVAGSICAMEVRHGAAAMEARRAGARMGVHPSSAGRFAPSRARCARRRRACAGASLCGDRAHSLALVDGHRRGAAMVTDTSYEAVSAHYGWRDWLSQRVTAVVMALYTLLVFGIVLWHGGLDYNVWKGLFASNAFKL